MNLKDTLRREFDTGTAFWNRREFYVRWVPFLSLYEVYAKPSSTVDRVTVTAFYIVALTVIAFALV